MTPMAYIRKIDTGNAPKAIGPYSQAVVAGDFVFVSGNIGMNPETMKLVAGGIKEQTEQALSNIDAVLRATGLTLDDVVRCTVFLKDIADWPVMNEVYAKRFVSPVKPAREAIQAAKLPLDALVEISVIAYMGSITEMQCCTPLIGL